MNEFPSITVCNEQLFDKIWFNKYFDSQSVTYLIANFEIAFDFEEIEDFLRECPNSNLNFNDISRDNTNFIVRNSILELIFINLIT